MLLEPICFNCKHYKGKYKCAAFPDGIPDEIVSGDDGHSEVRPDQEGEFVFEPEKENS